MTNYLRPGFLIQLIALGGAIDTGLFYGAAESIRLVEPGIVLSYLMGGAIIYLIMRMLGEMSTQEPVAGAFSDFANRYCGGFATEPRDIQPIIRPGQLQH